MTTLLASTRRSFVVLLIASVLSTGLALSAAPPASACSPGFTFIMEHFLEAQTLDDLHRPDSAYGEFWAKAFADELGDDLPEITGVTLLQTVAEISAPLNDPELDPDRYRTFGGVMVIKHAWGDVDSPETPQVEDLRLSVNSCQHLNSLHELGDDVWHVNGDFRNRTSQVGTAELITALDRLFGEPASPQRDIVEEGELIAELERRMQEQGDRVVTPVEPVTWLNPATGQVEAWDEATAAQPTAVFTG